jgi:hypothetical protein
LDPGTPNHISNVSFDNRSGGATRIGRGDGDNHVDILARTMYFDITDDAKVADAEGWYLGIVY